MRSTLALAAASAAVAAGVLAAPAGAFTIHCGQTITQNVTIANDLAGCPSPALVIGANNVVVDLNGHTITAQPMPPIGSIGVDLSGHSGVTLRNGFVRNFPIDIDLSGNGNTLSRMRTIRDAGIALPKGFTTGVLGDNVSQNRILDSTQSGNGSGISLFDDSGHNTIAGDLATNNGTGIHLEGLESEGGNSISASTLNGNDTGIRLLRVEHTVVSNNTLTGNGTGVNDVLSHNSTMVSNRVTGKGSTVEGSGFAFAGLLSDSGPFVFTGPELVQGNQVFKQHFGYVAGQDAQVTFRGNRAQLNGVGFQLNSALATLISNIAGSTSNLAGGTGGNGTGIVIRHEGNDAGMDVLTNNSASNNTGGPDGPGDGIVIGAGISHQVVGNVANRNAGSGFNIAGATFQDFANNEARYNRRFGFEIVQPYFALSFDGGGNHASHNVLGDCPAKVWIGSSPTSQNVLTCLP